MSTHYPDGTVRSRPPAHPLTDPITFPLEYKQWLVAFLQGELELSRFSGYQRLAAGATGPAGPAGPPGPPGGSYEFTQGTPSTSWVIVHNLGVHPAVTVVDTGGTTIDPDVHYDSLNQVTLTFGAATTGKVYLN